MRSIETPFSKLLDIRYPIIGAPMFLVSNPDMVVKISESGGVGTLPSLNIRPQSELKTVLRSIKSRTKKPIGVNIIVNKSNTRQFEDLRDCLEAGVELFITSLGNPQEVIKEAHKNGAKVLCDVTNVSFAKKVEDLGADGIIAVSSGAGGHAGHISPLVLIPWLKKSVRIPIIAAGGIAHGSQIAASLALGADGVSVGTRFIASHEAQVVTDYKQAIVKASPEDILMTSRISGTPAAVIRTPFTEKLGTELPWLIKKVNNNPVLKKFITPVIHLLGAKALEEAATKPTWKNVWSAGQSVGLIDEILSCEEIMERLVCEYFEAIKSLPS
ncbi:MAG: nitronate monooxygenase [Bdellovibrionaceae bacterium]|nr:nitronate monooxygenase [Pseudobdellovibrionaceae bacterium]